MSRYQIQISEKYLVAYGFDRMLPKPGYFMHVYDLKVDDGSRGVVECIGLTEGVDNHTFLATFRKWVPQTYIDSSPKVQDHVTYALMDIPF